MKDQLWMNDEESYGEDYRRHLLEQYKLYVEMADRVSARRGTANNFLLSVNALLVSGFGVLTSVTEDSAQTWQFALPLAGVVVCTAWLVLVRSYRQINTGKFQVIHELEKRLPAALYNAEWEALDRGKGKEYVALTRVEQAIPIVFVLVYVALMAASVIDIIN